MRRHISATFVVLLGAWALFNATRTAQHILRFYTPLPIWDYWRVVEHLPNYQSLQLGVLWQQHNEHRIVFPEIVFATDMSLAHGRMILPLLVSSFSYVVTWLILSLTIVAEPRMRKIDRVIAALLAGVVALFETATMVLAVPFLLQWTAVQVAAATSFFFLSYLREKQSVSWLGATVAAATLGTYSSANGLALWPMLLSIGLLLGLGGRSMIGLSGAAILNVGIYFIGYHFQGSLDLRSLLAQPVYTLGFLASYVSVPVGCIKAPAFGLTIGSINVLLALVSLCVAWRSKLLSYRAGIVLFSYYAFTVVTALMTAIGRMNAADRSFLTAKSLRYISIPQMNWAALILIILWLCSVSKWRDILFPTFCLVFSLGWLIAFAKLDRWVSFSGKSFAEAQQAAVAIQNGVMNRELILHYVYPDFDVVVVGLTRLRAANLSIYYRSGGGTAF